MLDPGLGHLLAKYRRGVLRLKGKRLRQYQSCEAEKQQTEQGMATDKRGYDPRPDTVWSGLSFSFFERWCFSS